MSNPETRIHRMAAGSAVRRRAPWLAAALGAMATATVASAALPLKTVEECLESGTDLVALPGVAGGTLTASECRGCPSLHLKFDRQTRYFIGTEPVSYTRLRQVAGQEAVRLYVFYSPETRTLTRLRLVAAGNAK